MTTVRFNAVSKTYDGLTAVGDATFEIGASSWCVISGANGSGKTTLLQLATGLQEPSRGVVCIDADRAGSPPARRAVSYLPDSPPFFTDLSLRGHIEYLAGLYDDLAVIDLANDAVRAFGLDSRVDDLPGSFSRGMKQKAAIALTLARPASVLLLDEPTRGLDASGADVLVKLLRRRHANGTTVVTVAHEPDLFAHDAGMQIRMIDGRAQRVSGF